METARPMALRTGERRRISRMRQRQITFFLFIAPWLTGFVFLQALPLLVGLLTSFTNYDGLNLDSVRFVGLRNYVRAFSDPDTGYSFSRTLLWSALNVPLWLVGAFGLALLLNRDMKGRGIFRTLLYIPSVVPVVATIWVWRIFLDTNYGALNGMLSLVRPGTAVPFLTDHALQSLTAIALWTGLGSGMVIFLAGLQGISTELVEAARLDGANRLQITQHITLPLMSPIIFFQFVLALIASFQQLVIPLLLSSIGGQISVPPRSSYLYMVHVYQQIFVNQRFGYGTALLWLLFVVILVLTLIIFRTSRYWVHYETDQEGGKR